MRLFNAGLASVGVVLLTTSGLAYSAGSSGETSGALEEIVVTAQKRSESLQDVPISIAVLTGDAIASQKLQSLSDLSGRLPNVYVGGGTITNSLFIRGVGSGVNVGFEQSVATFEDGVYHGRSKYSTGTFVDVAQLEVLRGPQSLYFGNNAIGGAFSVTSRRPGKVWEGQVSESYEFNAKENIIEAAAGGPLSDTVGVRLAGRVSNMKGWIQDLASGERNPDDNNKFGRVTLVWDAAKDWTVTLKGELGQDHSIAPNPTRLTNCPPLAEYPSAVWQQQLCGAAIAMNEANTSDTQRYGLAGEKGSVRSSDVMLNIEHKTDDGPGFAAQIAHTQFNSSTNGATAGVSIPWFQYSDYEKYSQTSVEMRLTSPDSAKLKYIVGVYGMRDNLDVDTPIVFSFLTPVIGFLEGPYCPYVSPDSCLPPGVLSQFTPLGVDVGLNQHESTYSGFGSLSYPLADKLTATVGGRWTRSQKDGTQFTVNQKANDNFNSNGTAVPGTLIEVAPGYSIPLFQILAQAFTTYQNHSLTQSLTGQAFLPSGNLTYKWTDDVSTYVSYSKGWKAGGFDGSDTVSDPAALTYGPETVQSYELGLKSMWLDHRLSFNVGIFNSEYKGLQQGVTVATATSVVVHTMNVGNLTSRGVEVDANYRINRIWRAGLNFSYLDAKYGSYDNAGCTQLQSLHAPAGQVCYQSLSGKAPPFAPKYTGNAQLGFAIPVGANLQLSGDAILSFSDKYDMLGVNDPIGFQSAWNKVDLRVGLGGLTGNWEVAAIVKNITDEHTSYSWNPAVYGMGSYTSVTDRGRQIAVQGIYKW